MLLFLLLLVVRPGNANIIALTKAFEVILDSTARVVCNASGFPRPYIRWQLPGEPELRHAGNAPVSVNITEIPTEVEGPDNMPALLSILTIQSSQRVHNGTYTCTATTMSTPVTSATETTDITVLGKTFMLRYATTPVGNLGES